MAESQKSTWPMSETTYANEVTSSKPAALSNLGIWRMARGLAAIPLVTASS
jgi:hypothetical protein